MTNSKQYGGFRDLIVFKLAYQLAVEIFNETKKYPKEEKFSLVDQIRRSARAVPAIIAEAWSRRRYPKSFICKLLEAYGEASETKVWLGFSRNHDYLESKKYDYIKSKYDEFSRMFYSIINQPEKFCY
jgi:four helix bundle protein